ncbi:hypothetical protein [Paenibacillus zeirhizosphaerae]
MKLEGKNTYSGGTRSTMEHLELSPRQLLATET